MASDTPETRLSVAFADIVNPGWTAGSHYYANLFRALKTIDDDERPRITVLVAPRQRDGGYETYRHLADEVVEEPPRPRAGTMARATRRLRPGAADARGAAIAQRLRADGVDAMFACWMELGARFELPLLGWIPDFQHKHRPEFFSADENRQRDLLFDRMAANCSRIVVSSEDGRRDYATYHPEHAAKARVLRFVAQVPDGVYEGDPRLVCEQYHLPERFLYLPNQFWVHKNHGLVLESLARLKTRRPEITVVCTGNPADNRDPLHFGKLLERVSRLGLRDTFVVLGWVPQETTFRLLRQSVAVLQPSLFEGWSTTVEETKSIGKSIVLSDIPVHREQAAPGAVLFDPTDADALAACMERAYDTCLPGPDERLERDARAALPTRTRAYAEDFIAIVRDVARDGA